jgi:HEAT repeat protein
VNVAGLLRIGDRRSLGRSAEVLTAVVADPGLLPDLLACLSDSDDVVRMRAGDVLEKVARERPEAVRPWLDRLFSDLAGTDQPSLQWHFAQILEEVPLDAGQYASAVRFLRALLERSDDWIVLTSTMQSLTTLAANDPALREWLPPHLRSRMLDRRPAVAKRAAGQLARLGERDVRRPS